MTMLSLPRRSSQPASSGARAECARVLLSLCVAAAVAGMTFAHARADEASAPDAVQPAAGPAGAAGSGQLRLPADIPVRRDADASESSVGLGCG